MERPIQGRGAVVSPPNRFERFEYVPEVDDGEWNETEDVHPATVYLSDPARSIIARNDSPDVGFETSINPYRGCEHGCVYCFARPTHEYLGFSSGLDFETKILVKNEAPELLRKELQKPGWKPQVLAVSGVTDCYQPIERKLKLTRRCLEVAAEFRNPVIIITKSALVTRDLDILRQLADHSAAAVVFSVTTLDDHLARVLEPRAPTPQRKLEAIKALSDAGIPVGVMIAPVIPALTDYEIPRLLDAASNAGARFAGFTLLRLPYGLTTMFEAWLEVHFPDRKERVLSRISQVRDGRLNDARWGSRMRGEGVFADQVATLFKVGCARAGISTEFPKLSTASFRRSGQQPLFR